VAVVEKASWPGERKVSGTLATISELVKEADIKKTAMILVGNVLSGIGKESRLYDKHFSHEFRCGQKK